MITWDEAFDLVIVGSGGGGMCAGLAGVTAGKRPIILEKMSKVGGTTARSGGVMWVPNNSLMRAAGVPDSIDEALAYMQDISHYAGPATQIARHEAYLRFGIEMVDFLLREGIELEYVDGWADHYPSGSSRGRLVASKLFNTKKLGGWLPKLETYITAMPMTGREVGKLMLVKRTLAGFVAGMKLVLRSYWCKLYGWPLFGLGPGLQGQMLHANLKRGVPIWVDTAVVDLIEEEGRVVGVSAMRQGRMIHIRALDGVLLNAGSFSRNQRLRDQYLPKPTSADWSIASLGDTGDLLERAQALGAATELMDMGNWAPASVTPSGEPMFMLGNFTKPFSMVVDRLGDRFCNEANAGLSMVAAMYARNNTVPTIPAWLIMDSRHLKSYPFLMNPPGLPPNKWVENGYFLKSDTIEGLAEQCSIDPGRLRETVLRFNQFALAGRDEDFHRGDWAYERYYGDPSVKPNPSLGPIQKAPFFATQLYPADGGLFGGLSTDEHARVIRMDGSVIPGLYAAGTSAATVFGYNYPCSGGAVGFSFIWGYIAAIHASRPSESKTSSGN